MGSKWGKDQSKDRIKPGEKKKDRTEEKIKPKK